MIGGGQLAYTLLGIFTSNNSKTLFLILDPHYTGKDDLKTIVGKGTSSSRKNRFDFNLSRLVWVEGKRIHIP